MKDLILVLSITAVSLTGCTHQFLRRNTSRQSSTITDLVYEQVLDNLAMFESNPYALPYFAVIGNGTTQAVDNAGADVALTWNATTIISERLGLNGRRQLMEQWSTAPVMSADRLARLRCAYQLVVLGYPIQFIGRPRKGTEHDAAGSQVWEFVLPEDESQLCVRCIKKLIAFGYLPKPADPGSAKYELGKTRICFKAEDATTEATNAASRAAAEYANTLRRHLACHFPRGWYGVADSKRCVRKDACYVGKYCNTYVWVPFEGVDALSRFSMTVLNLASRDSLIPTLQVEWKLDGITLKQTTRGNIADYSAKRLQTDETGAMQRLPEVEPAPNMPLSQPGGAAVVPQVIP